MDPIKLPETVTFERQESYVELARLKCQTLPEHEGYMRLNDGSWLVRLPENFEGSIAIPFQGKAKRGQSWNAPDPVGQAIAREVVRLWNQRKKVQRLMDALGALAIPEGNFDWMPAGPERDELNAAYADMLKAER